MTDQIKRISKEAAIDIWKSQCAAFVGVSGFLCLGRLFQGQPNEAALCI